MDKVCNNSSISKKNDLLLVKVNSEDDRNSELLRLSANRDWWPNFSENEKSDSRQRWSYGSDISSIETGENIQNRLCCSPVDEFDSTISSDNEDLIVNNIDYRDETGKNFIEEYPGSSPIFENVICTSRNKKVNKSQDVDTADDELIDYSKRYTTDSSICLLESRRHGSSHFSQRSQRGIPQNTGSKRTPMKKTSVNRSKVDPFGDYAETDLDQPTNYSLRYTEEDSGDEDENVPQFFGNNDQEDTIQTYYTEGTPNNFSNATSVSDLLSLEDGKGRDVIFKRPLSQVQRQVICDKSEKNLKDCRNQMRKKYISEVSKSLVLKENGELNNRKVYERQEKLLTPPQSPAEPTFKDKESKIVTFNVIENDAQETPLMFSRCSSLDSLSEFEQQSIHDDRSSVISDFSHRTSGAVSPNELPDSPTQSIPPSVHLLKQNESMQSRTSNQKFITQQQQKGHNKPLPLCSLRNQSEPQNSMFENNSVFADELVAFKEESMPLSNTHSIVGNTLSALTIDDTNNENEIVSDKIINQISAIRVRASAAGMQQAPVQKQQDNNQLHHQLQVGTIKAHDSMQVVLYDEVNNRKTSSGNHIREQLIKEKLYFINEDNDKTLCINNHVHKDFQNNKCKDTSTEFWCENEVRSDNRNYLNNRIPLRHLSNKRGIRQQNFEGEEIIAIDTIRIYCTEDTPTYVSPYGSQSNLSALSVLSFSDENLNFYEPYQHQPCAIYEDEYFVDGYNSDDASISDYSGAEDNDRRIDVSPFDSQLNLVNFSLLCIEEEDEDVEPEENEINNDPLVENNESEDFNAYKRLSYENSDMSDEDRQVLEECIKSGVSKLTRRREDSDLGEQHHMF